MHIHPVFCHYAAAPVVLIVSIILSFGMSFLITPLVLLMFKGIDNLVRADQLAGTKWHSNLFLLGLIALLWLMIKFICNKSY